VSIPQTVSKPPENALQQAIVTRLRASTALAGKLAAARGVTPAVPAVLDEVREGQAYPYVRVGDHLSTLGGDLTSFGRQVTETLHVWTKAGSMGPGQAITDIVVGLLDRQHEALSALLRPLGHRVVSCRYEYGQALDDPDPEIRHHVIRFRVETAQVS
jgi:hypothetical protein